MPRSSTLHVKCIIDRERAKKLMAESPFAQIHHTVIADKWVCVLGGIFDSREKDAIVSFSLLESIT